MRRREKGEWNTYLICCVVSAVCVLATMIFAYVYTSF